VSREFSTKPESSDFKTVAVFAVAAGLALLRFSHAGVLWADEDYHLAAAAALLKGKVPYRDFWYDKPPLTALFYLLDGALPGWPLRLLGACFVLALAWAAFLLARELWGAKEGRLAALLAAFYLTFYLPTAVIPLDPDQLMLLPQLLAVYCAWRGRGLLSGIFSGICFALNAKGLLVILFCAALCWASLVPFLLGLLAPLAVLGAWLGWNHALIPYWQQVWEWGLKYARNSPVQAPVSEGLKRTFNWAGFHAAIAVGATACWIKDRGKTAKWLALWAAISFAGVCIGARFLPRYYMQLLPPILIAGSWGICYLWGRRAGKALVALLLLIPLVRFGPRYLSMGTDLITGQRPAWADVAMDLDSQDAAGIIRGMAGPTDSLYVWGYRPNLYVYTRLSPPGRFWDSQPVTGVPADRYMQSAQPLDLFDTSAFRHELAGSSPTFIVDGASLYNPALSMQRYPELKEWLSHYRLAGRSGMSLIYKRN
jgi:hypothetical protein